MSEEAGTNQEGWRRAARVEEKRGTTSQEETPVEATPAAPTAEKKKKEKKPKA